MLDRFHSLLADMMHADKNTKLSLFHMFNGKRFVKSDGIDVQESNEKAKNFHIKDMSQMTKKWHGILAPSDGNYNIIFYI